jgi:hypothetical protein
MVSWWPGDGNANDIRDGNNGVVQGGVSFPAARVGPGFTFDSDDDRVVIPHNANLNVQGTGFTADFWMRAIGNQPNDPGGLAALLEKSHGFADQTGWAFQVDIHTGAPSFAMPNGTTITHFTVPSDVLDGGFHHIAGTWDGSTMRLFVDGAQSGSAPNPTASSPAANNTRALNIGFAWGGAPGQETRFFRGQVDEVEKFDRALSQAEIQSIVAAGSAGKCKGPVVQMPTSKDDCKDGGWRNLTDDTGRPFKNQGDCVSFVATKGKNKAGG